MMRSRTDCRAALRAGVTWAIVADGEAGPLACWGPNRRARRAERGA